MNEKATKIRFTHSLRPNSFLPSPPLGPSSAGFFLRAIEESRDLIDRFGRFSQDVQRQEVLHLFEEGRKVYAALRSGA